MSRLRIVVVDRSVLVWIGGALLVAALWGAVIARFSVPVVSRMEAVSGKLVAIDPGHGGADPGAVGASGVLEKDIVLQVARLLRPHVERAFIRTLMLREVDVDLADGSSRSRKQSDLRRRVELANESGADLYVSLHANSYPNPRWSGAQTFYYPGKEDGRALAEAIQARLVAAFPENTRKARPGEYFVLRETKMPSVVVEVGFLSNPEEEKRLRSPDIQERIAAAIFAGIVDFLAAGGPPLAPSHVDVLAPAPPAAAASDRFLLPYIDGSEGEGFAWAWLPYPESWNGATPEERIHHALASLGEGPPGANGQSPLPPGTRITGVALEGRRLTVDLSIGALRSWAGGAAAERLLIESIVQTAAQFPGVDEVMITVDGDVDGTLFGHVDIGRPFPAPGPGGSP